MSSAIPLSDQPAERSVTIVFTRCPSGHFPLFRPEKDRVPQLFEQSHCYHCGPDSSDFEITELTLGVVPESIARTGFASQEPTKIVAAGEMLF